METTKNTFLVGLFVIAGVACLLMFTLWLAGAGKGETTRYQIHFAESVGGLKIGSPVKFRGVNVGTVEKMNVDPDDPNLVRVDVNVLKTAPIKAGTTATLKLQGLTGEIYIDLSGGDPHAPNLADVSPNTVPDIVSEPSSINAIMTRLPEILDKLNVLLEKADHIAMQADKIFSERNVKAVNGVVHRLAEHYGSKESEDDDSAQHK